MFSANDVIDLMRRVSVVVMQQTILTAIRRAFRDETPKPLLDVTRQVGGAGELVL